MANNGSESTYEAIRRRRKKLIEKAGILEEDSENTPIVPKPDDEDEE